jgi:hypothetical protein
MSDRRACLLKEIRGERKLKTGRIIPDKSFDKLLQSRIVMLKFGAPIDILAVPSDFWK